MQQFPICQTHQDSQVEFLYVCDDKVRLFCSQCIYQSQDGINQVSMKDVFHLKLIQKEPERILHNTKNNLEKLKVNDDFASVELLIKMLEKNLTFLEQLKKKVELLSQNTIIKLQEAKQIQNQMRIKLYEMMKFDEFLKKNQDWNGQICSDQTDDYVQKATSLYLQLEELRQHTTVQYAKSTEEVFNKSEEITKFRTTFYDEYTKLITCVNQQFLEVSGKIYIQENSSSLIDLNYFHYLCGLVETRLHFQISEVKMIYKSPSPSIYCMRREILGLKNLLIIFKSVTGYTFGIFTPCVWENNAGSYDQSLSSFLFSYTLSEIYPIKGVAINSVQFICTSYMKFGGSGDFHKKDNDLYIESDFQNGFSQLGVGFEAKSDQEQTQKKLFGGEKPNINFCEIYQFI